MPVKFPCGVCNKSVNKNHRALQCDICSKWIHIKCNLLNKTNYSLLENSTEPWFCINCINHNIPYSNIPNNELELINQGINYNFNNNLNLNLFPTDNLNSFYTNCPNFLSNIYEANSSQNCKYYDINDFTKTKFSNNNFSILHLNISSISGHIEELKTLLSLTKHKFDIIAISESRIKINNTPINNILIENYSYEHIPTESSAGGVMLYIGNHLNYKIRKDLSIYKAKELESIFIEIIFPKTSNIIVGCVYKHPFMDPDEFSDTYLTKLIN